MSDVCLILEGTYPYITGGVSAWVHNLIKGLPGLKFSLLTILPSGDVYKDYKYDIPSNVVSVTRVYVHQSELSNKRAPFIFPWRKGGWRPGQRRELFRMVDQFYMDMARGEYTLLPGIFTDMINPATRVISPADIFNATETWDLLVKHYDLLETTESFIDYFWTWRYSHMPLLRLFDVQIPRASVYHTVSTGYAGVAAVFSKLITSRPMIITEHGIYTNERRIEIEQANWIYERKIDRTVITANSSLFKEIWISLFEHFSRVSYAWADEIITLFENNRKMQIRGGADPWKTSVIPNGIKLSRFPFQRKQGKTVGPFVIGFVGRVVPIKDVKTFIRACRIITDEFPDTLFRVMGPCDEDTEYFEECRTMVSMLGLQENLEFTGPVNVSREYPNLDLLVLTSVSEGMPLVILEAGCCGVASVASDVGACSELLNGRTSEDQALGVSGLVTPIADHESTAEAVISILRKPHLLDVMGESARRRTEIHYNEEDLNFAYQEIYRKYIDRV
ncbi:MAG: group 1 glycosyl transferase [Candidatus Wallbacteria bacterium HGW-Wallbacteria-1]|jgi:glycosyltransferase involved in cell wall biosynthesis|uniref:Group 1 glycosyl transferase n=1 Tax=Candidatus Wallbacteria bacterium HGW-Wallbacteria-1 TaxID=2013854 RepID=A0A2N1PN05_9BACT|nr:MAG: group 1 glycosyl transferase [Candidatus Wallbacteria bacterium HGW-Wallbacteria-1]